MSGSDCSAILKFQRYLKSTVSVHQEKVLSNLGCGFSSVGDENYEALGELLVP
jgi:hypothetical protein